MTQLGKRLDIKDGYHRATFSSLTESSSPKHGVQEALIYINLEFQGLVQGAQTLRSGCRTWGLQEPQEPQNTSLSCGPSLFDCFRHARLTPRLTSLASGNV